MRLKPILLGTIAYTFVTFPIAVLWHVVLFKEKYEAFSYIEGEPRFLIGFITILMQGAILSFLYPLVRLAGKPVIRGLKYAAILGAFFWTSHVLALIAKQQMAGAALFAAMESVYLCLQFGIYGILIGLIYGDRSSVEDKTV